MSENKNEDYFVACIEDGSLMMRPYCGLCGVQLNEDYYCLVNHQVSDRDGVVLSWHPRQ